MSSEAQVWERHKPPRWFKPVAGWALLIAVLMWWPKQVSDPGSAEAALVQRGIEAQVRMTEGAPIIIGSTEGAPEPSAEEADAHRNALGMYADLAEEVALGEGLTSGYREQAAAIVLILGDREADVIEQLLPNPTERSDFGHWLALAAKKEGLDAESVLVLRDAEISPWLRSRLRAWSLGPDKALDPDGMHARTELPWLTRASTILVFYLTLGLIGSILIILWYVRRRDRVEEPPSPSPWEPPLWAGTGAAMAWFCVYFTGQFVVGSLLAMLDAGQTVFAASIVASQVGAGVFALYLLGQFNRAPMHRSILGALTTLQLGVEPLDGSIMRALSWGIGGFAAAIPLMVTAVIVQTYLPFQPEVISNPVIPEIVNPESGLAQALLMAAVILGASFFEEIVFRGALYRALRTRLGAKPSIAISAAIFAAVHPETSTLIPLFFLGCLLAVLAERTKGLLVPMMVHGFWNGGQILIAVTIYGG
ncbi:MAG: membrane protease YdiL (CAAX protease family) [Myxococcota bacterium]